eukprot:gene68995-94550_t
MTRASTIRSRSGAGRFGAEFAHPGDAIFGLDVFVDAGVQFADDLLGRLGGRGDGEPRRGLVTGHASLGDGGEVGHQRPARRRGNGDRADRTGFGKRLRGRQVVDGQVHAAGDQVRQRR